MKVQYFGPNADTSKNAAAVYLTEDEADALSELLNYIQTTLRMRDDVRELTSALHRHLCQRNTQVEPWLAEPRIQRRAKGTGRLYRRGHVWWIQYTIDGQRVQESSGSRYRKDAEELLEYRLAQGGS